MTDDTRKLIEEAEKARRRAAWFRIGEEPLWDRVIAVLRATLPTEDDARALERVIYEAWNMERGDVIPWIGEAGRLKLAHAIFEHFRSPVPPEPTIDEWRSLIHAERATHAEKGYTPEHDREHGPEHLIDWAIDYARRGKTVESAALMLALRDLLLPAVPPGVLACTVDESGGMAEIQAAKDLLSAAYGPGEWAVPPETDEAYIAWAAQEADREQARVFRVGLGDDFVSGWRDGFEAGLLHCALAAVPPVTEEREHDRDGMLICRRCGRGLTAVEILDGERPCVPPVMDEMAEDDREAYVALPSNYSPPVIEEMVTTVEELDALLEGSVVLVEVGNSAFPYRKCEGHWEGTDYGHSRPRSSSFLRADLPARVLYRPVPEGEER